VVIEPNEGDQELLDLVACAVLIRRRIENSVFYIVEQCGPGHGNSDLGMMNFVKYDRPVYTQPE